MQGNHRILGKCTLARQQVSTSTANNSDSFLSHSSWSWTPDAPHLLGLICCRSLWHFCMIARFYVSPPVLRVHLPSSSCPCHLSIVHSLHFLRRPSSIDLNKWVPLHKLLAISQSFSLPVVDQRDPNEYLPKLFAICPFRPKSRCVLPNIVHFTEAPQIFNKASEAFHQTIAHKFHPKKALKIYNDF